MCGIVGYIGNKKAMPILKEGLLALEYRGYDSAGIATIEQDKVVIMKNKGRVNNLDSIEGIYELNGTVGIAHTRWATHGKPSKVNSHPHQDSKGVFTVVHNGIIENYAKLKEFLTKEGYEFISETDTEIIPNLINYYYNKNEKNEEGLLKTIKETVDNLEGSYAIQVISKEFPDRIVVVRKDSPCIIGKGIGENYIASDIPAILKHTNEFYFLEDNEIAVVQKDHTDFYDKNLNVNNKNIKVIDWDANAATKDGFEDFMLKEIFEQPIAVRRTLGDRIVLDSNTKFDELGFTKEFLQGLNRIYIVACGTAMHAGLIGKNIIEKMCKIPVSVEIASEFRYNMPLIDEKTLCIYISQSGETADTIAALKLAKEKNAKTLVISNVIGSSITRETDFCIYTMAGPEIAVASTKAYTSQVTLITMLGIYFAEILKVVPQEEIEELKKEILALPMKLESILDNVDEIKQIALNVYGKHDAFFLGRGADYYVSMEGSLKLKEISYIHSEAYPAGELKHGPIALIEDDVLVVVAMTDEKLIAKSVSNVQEVISRGARTLIITNQEIENKGYDYIIRIPKTSSLISPILAILPMQLLSYYIAKNKKLDVDKPRNLAKSVTVE